MSRSSCSADSKAGWGGHAHGFVGGAALGVPVLFVAVVFWSLGLADGNFPVALPDRAMEAIVYLGTFGSVLGFILYYYMINTWVPDALR